ncbi:hypothetical protein [Clostridium sp. DL1XJH146]
MEDWELEESFKEGIKKEEFYREGYRESINIIALDRFVGEVKNECDIISFKEIYKTELTSWTRYFGMDDEKIYYRVKNFESKVEDIYSISKITLETELVRSIKLNDDGLSAYYNLWHDVKNRNIYETKIIGENKKIVNEIYNINTSFTLDNKREDIDSIIGDYVISSFWTEDDNGDNYKDFVKIKNTKSGATNIYEGVCAIFEDSVILFK